jgi:hypothetical protein
MGIMSFAVKAAKAAKKAEEAAKLVEAAAKVAKPAARAAKAVAPVSLAAKPQLAIRTKPSGIIAYHGSPHTFDRFDVSKIGTGEGAQAYGHGLYFAENEDVAKAYRDKVKDMGAIRDVNSRMAELAKIMSADEIPGRYRKYRSAAGADAAREYDDLMGKRSDISGATGSMYQVRIDADPSNFLDWDAPVSANATAQKLGDKFNMDTSESPRKLLSFLSNSPVGHLRLSDFPEKFAPPPVLASALLRKEGIPGIKYLDQDSRAAGGGSRNFVVFDDALVNILRRYAVGGAVHELADKYNV